MKKHNRELAEAISKRYKASGVDIAPETIVKHLITLCEAPNQSEKAMVKEQMSWQRFIAFEGEGYVDEFGCDSDGVFLLALAKKLRQEFIKAVASRHGSRYKIRLLEDNNGLDVTPLLRAYDKWLCTGN